MESGINVLLSRQIGDNSEDVLVGPELLLEDTIGHRMIPLRLRKQDTTALGNISNLWG